MTRTRISTAVAAAAASPSTPTTPTRLRLVTNKKCPFAQKTWIGLECYYHSNNNSGSSSSSSGPTATGDYELLEVGLYGGNGKPGWFLEISPKGQVPVLWLPSGRTITESDTILDHLLTLPGPNPLLPPSPETYQQWRALLGPFLKTARTAIERGDDASLSSALSKLEKQIPPPSPYLAGTTFSVADCGVLPFMQRLVDGYRQVVEEAAPGLYAWYGLAKEEKCFQATKVGGYWMWW
jgi:glutathione S-transferase